MQATNITELLGKEKVETLLRLCGASPNPKGIRPSDYDLFYSLLVHLPLCKGHRIEQALEALQCRFFQGLSLTPPNAQAIWQSMARALFEQPITLPPCYREATEAPFEELDPVFPRDVTHLLYAPPCTVEAWEKQIQRMLSQNNETAILHLPLDFSFVSPNPYRVSLALQKEKREKGDQDLIACQLIRQWCGSRGGELILEGIGAAEAEKLCCYLRTYVCEPVLAMWVNVCEDMDALVDIAACFSGVRLAARAEAIAKEQQLILARAYPAGRVLLYKE